MQLVIGNKNYSSWSLRPWLLLSHFNVPFDEVPESLAEDNLSDRLAKYSPSRKVPVLIEDGLCVWDSLAICEYIDENYLDGNGWPQAAHKKAHARSITAEMHSSFLALRNALPMNCRAKRHLSFSPEVEQEIRYIDNMWEHCLTQYKGPWLFGDFSIADCFYAPVVMRFYTYGASLSALASNYVDTVRLSPHMQTWIHDAIAESEVVDVDEAGTDRQ